MPSDLASLGVFIVILLVMFFLGMIVGGHMGYLRGWRDAS